MRFKLLISTTLLCMLAAGCDPSESELRVSDVQVPGDGTPWEDLHPFTSCAVPNVDLHELHPACETACGGVMRPTGEEHAWCWLYCESDAECAPWAGDSIAQCAGVACSYVCNADHPCPDGLDCTGINEAGYGECFAPITEVPPPEPPPLLDLPLDPPEPPPPPPRMPT